MLSAWLTFTISAGLLSVSFWLGAYIFCLAKHMPLRTVLVYRWTSLWAGLVLGPLSMASASIMPQPYSPYAAMPGFLVGSLLAMGLEGSAHGPRYEWPWQIYGAIVNGTFYLLITRIVVWIFQERTQHI